MDPNFHVTSATFNHKFRNFSQITSLTQSPACWIQNMPWKIFIEPVIRDNRKYLSIFVSCAQPITSNPWSCRASVRSYKLDGSRPKIIKTTKYLVFDSTASTSWGHDTFILWDSVLKQSNGYITNDTVTIEVIIDAEEPVGLKPSLNYFTDERANVAINICDQTTSNLKSQILDLTTQNEKLQNSNKASSLNIDNLQNLLNNSEQKYADLQKKLDEDGNINTELRKSLDNTNEQLEHEKTKNNELVKTLNENKSKVAALSENLKSFESLKTELLNCQSAKEESENKFTSILNQFNNLKNDLVNSETQTESDLNSKLKALQNQNKELIENLAKAQNELKDANSKLTLLGTLQNQVEEFKQKENNMQKNLDIITKEILNSDLMIELVRKELGEEHQRTRIEKSNIHNHIESLGSKYNESSIKLKIFQDINEKILTQYKNLMDQIKMNETKYNSLADEKELLLSQMDDANMKLSQANANIANLKNDNDAKQKKIEILDSNLAETKNSITKLNETNNTLSSLLILANSKIKSFENNNSEDLTNLVNEKNELTSQNGTLRSQIESIKSELQDLKDKHLDDEVDRLKTEKTHIESQLEQVNKELENTKSQLSKSQKDMETLIANEKNMKLIKSELESYKNKLKVIEEKKQDQVIAQLMSDKTILQNLIDSLKKDLEKTKMNDSSSTANQIESLEKENVNHKKQIEGLQKLLNEVNSGIQTTNEKKAKMKRKNDQKPSDEETDNEKNLVENNENNNGSSQKNSNIKQDVTENMGHIQSDNELGEIRLLFEKIMKEADSVLKEERKSLTRRIEDLSSQLEAERKEHDQANGKQNELKREICKLRENIDKIWKLKEECIQKLKSSEIMCFDLLKMVLHILRDLKNTGKLTCYVEALIISVFNDAKIKSKFWEKGQVGSDNEAQNPINLNDISRDFLQEKINKLYTHFEDSMGIITRNSASEQNENSNLRTANKELLVVIEHEGNISKQYKKMLIMANSRLSESRRQLGEVENKFFAERTRRYEYEEMCRRSNLLLDETEFLMDDLKLKLMRHAIKLSDLDCDEELQNPNECVPKSSEVSSQVDNRTEDATEVSNSPSIETTEGLETTSEENAGQGNAAPETLTNLVESVSSGSAVRDAINVPSKITMPDPMTSNSPSD